MQYLGGIKPQIQRILIMTSWWLQDGSWWFLKNCLTSVVEDTSEVELALSTKVGRQVAQTLSYLQILEKPIWIFLRRQEQMLWN